MSSQTAEKLDTMGDLPAAFRAIPAEYQERMFADISAAARAKDMDLLLDTLALWVRRVKTAASAYDEPGTHHHPLASAAGSFAEDPLWDDLMDAIQEQRRRSRDSQRDASG